MDAVKSFNAELSSLYDVKPPISKAKMTAITRGAIKAIKFYKHVVQSVEKFILKCKAEYKVPGLYVIDSIVRQSRHQFGTDKDVFAPRFAKNMQQTFLNLFQCPQEDKSKIIRVLNLWQKNQVFAPDVIQPLFDLADPNNPIHKEIQQQMQMQAPTNGITIVKGSPALQKTPTKLPTPGIDHQGMAQLTTPNLGLVDPNVLAQFQQLQRLIACSSGVAEALSTESQSVHFDRKLLDYDYGEDDDDVVLMNASPANKQQITPQPQNILSTQQQILNLGQQLLHPQQAQDPVTNLLTNPEVLRQLQTLQQTMSNVTQQQQPQQIFQQQQPQQIFQQQQPQQLFQQQQPQQIFQQQQPQQIFQQHTPQQMFQQQPPVDIMDMDKIRKLQEMKQQEDEFDKHLAQTVPNLPFAAECDLKPNNVNTNIQMNNYFNTLPPPIEVHDQSPFDNQPQVQGMPSEIGYMDNIIHSSNTHADIEVINLDQAESPSPPRMPPADSPVTSTLNMNYNKDSSSDLHRKRSSNRRDRSRSPRKDSSRERRDKDRRSHRSRSRSKSRRHRSRSKDRNSRSAKAQIEKELEREKERKRRGLPSIKKENLSVCSTTLWVGHLSKSVQQSDLSNTFGEFGEVVSIDLIPPRGCAFIVMHRRQDAAKCLTKLKNHVLYGKAMTLAWAPGKGVKGKELKDYWEGDLGVSYIPWHKLKRDIDLELLEDGGMIDEDTMPDWMKAKAISDNAKASKTQENLPTLNFVPPASLVNTAQPPPISNLILSQPPPIAAAAPLPLLQRHPPLPITQMPPPIIGGFPYPPTVGSTSNTTTPIMQPPPINVPPPTILPVTNLPNAFQPQTLAPPPDLYASNRPPPPLPPQQQPDTIIASSYGDMEMMDVDMDVDERPPPTTLSVIQTIPYAGPLPEATSGFESTQSDKVRSEKNRWGPPLPPPPPPPNVDDENKDAGHLTPREQMRKDRENLLNERLQQLANKGFCDDGTSADMDSSSNQYQRDNRRRSNSNDFTDNSPYEALQFEPPPVPTGQESLENTLKNECPNNMFDIANINFNSAPPNNLMNVPPLDNKPFGLLGNRPEFLNGPPIIHEYPPNNFQPVVGPGGVGPMMPFVSGDDGPRMPYGPRDNGPRMQYGAGDDGPRIPFGPGDNVPRMQYGPGDDGPRMPYGANRADDSRFRGRDVGGHGHRSGRFSDNPEGDRGRDRDRDRDRSDRRDNFNRNRHIIPCGPPGEDDFGGPRPPHRMSRNRGGGRGDMMGRGGGPMGRGGRGNLRGPPGRNRNFGPPPMFDRPPDDFFHGGPPGMFGGPDEQGGPHRPPMFHNNRMRGRGGPPPPMGSRYNDDRRSRSSSDRSDRRSPRRRSRDRHSEHRSSRWTDHENKSTDEPPAPASEIEDISGPPAELVPDDNHTSPKQCTDNVQNPEIDEYESNCSVKPNDMFSSTDGAGTPLHDELDVSSEVQHLNQDANIDLETALAFNTTIATDNENHESNNTETEITQPEEIV